MPIVVGHDDTNGYASALGQAAYQAGQGQADSQAAARGQQAAQQQDRLAYGLQEHREAMAHQSAMQAQHFGQQQYGADAEMMRHQQIAQQHLADQQQQTDYQYTAKQRARLGELNNQEQQLNSAMASGVIHDDEGQEQLANIARERSGMKPLPVIKQPQPPAVGDWMQQGNYWENDNKNFLFFRQSDGKIEARPMKDESGKIAAMAQQHADANHQHELDRNLKERELELKQATLGQHQTEADARGKESQAKADEAEFKQYQSTYEHNLKRMTTESIDDQGNKTTSEPAPDKVHAATQSQLDGFRQWKQSKQPAPGVNPQASDDVHASAKRLMELEQQHRAGQTVNMAEVAKHMQAVQGNLQQGTGMAGTAQDSVAYFNSLMPTAAADPNAPLPQAPSPYNAPITGATRDEVLQQRLAKQTAIEQFEKPATVLPANPHAGQSVEYFKQIRNQDIDNWMHQTAAKELDQKQGSGDPYYEKHLAQQFNTTFPGSDFSQIKPYLDQVRAAHQKADRIQNYSPDPLEAGSGNWQVTNGVEQKAQLYHPTDEQKQQAAKFWGKPADKLTPEEIGNAQHLAAGNQQAAVDQMSKNWLLKYPGLRHLATAGAGIVTDLSAASAALNPLAKVVPQVGPSTDDLNRGMDVINQTRSSLDKQAGIPEWMGSLGVEVPKLAGELALTGKVGDVAGLAEKGRSLLTAAFFGTAGYSKALTQYRDAGVGEGAAHIAALGSGIVQGAAIMGLDAAGLPGSFGKAEEIASSPAVRSGIQKLAEGTGRFGTEVLGNMGVMGAQTVGQAAIDFAATGDRGKIEAGKLFNSLADSAIQATLLPVAMHGLGKAQEAAGKLLENYRQWRADGGRGVPPPSVLPKEQLEAAIPQAKAASPIPPSASPRFFNEEEVRRWARDNPDAARQKLHEVDRDPRAAQAGTRQQQFRDWAGNELSKQGAQNGTVPAVPAEQSAGRDSGQAAVEAAGAPVRPSDAAGTPPGAAAEGPAGQAAAAASPTGKESPEQSGQKPTAQSPQAVAPDAAYKQLNDQIRQHERERGYNQIVNQGQPGFRSQANRDKMNLRDNDEAYQGMLRQQGNMRRAEASAGTKADNAAARERGVADAAAGRTTPEAVKYAQLHTLPDELRQAIQRGADDMLSVTKSEATKAALKKIIEDAGSDTGAAVEKQKEKILGVATGQRDWRNAIQQKTEQPYAPDPIVKLFMQPPEARGSVIDEAMRSLDRGQPNELAQHAAERLRLPTSEEAEKPPAATAFRQAETGKSFETRLMRGQGRADSPYSQFVAQQPILGPGRWTSPSREYAEHFGTDVTEHDVSLKNPLVIRDDGQWRKLTAEAGWKHPNPFGGDPASMKADIASIRKLIESKGHDGVVIDPSEEGDSAKNLQRVFGAQQAVEFRPTARTTREFGESPPPASPDDVREFLHTLRGRVGVPGAEPAGVGSAEAVPFLQALAVKGDTADAIQRRGLKPSGDAPTDAIRALSAPAKMLDDVRKVFNPQARSEPAMRMGEEIRSAEGTKTQLIAQAEETAKAVRRGFARYTQDDAVKFIGRMQRGESQPTSELQRYANVARGMLDDSTARLQAIGKLLEANADYFPQIWDDPKRAEQWLGRKPVEGQGEFLKQRWHKMVEDGIAAGLKLKSSNPMDLVLEKIRSQDRYAVSTALVNRQRAVGLGKMLNVFSKLPEGWKWAGDDWGRVFKRFGRPQDAMTEWVDEQLYNRTSDLARKYGVEPQRVPEISGEEGIPSGALGMYRPPSKSGRPEEIRTRFATPISGMVHEVTHLLDNRFHMYKELNRGGDTDAEMKAISNLRFPGRPEKKAAYLNSPTERVGMVGEAYVHAPELLKQTAPTVYQRFEQFMAQREPDFLKIKPSLQYKELPMEQSGPPGLTITHRLAMPEGAWQVWNNHLSRGLRGFAPYDLYMGLGNAMNQVELGMSFWHGTGSILNSALSDASRGIQKTSRGRFVEAAGHFLSGATMLPNAVRDFRFGSQLRKAYRAGLDAIQDPNMREVVSGMMMSNHRIEQDRQFANRSTLRLQKAMNDLRTASGFGKVTAAARTAGNAPLAALDQLAKPLMGQLVPNLKTAAFGKLYSDELTRLGPDSTVEQRMKAAQRVGDSIDNRFGQFTYDNLFWDRHVKDLLMGTFRSLGWNLGDVRELAGSVPDLLRTKQRLGEGQQIVSHKMAYAAALPLLVGAWGAGLNWLLHGSGPQSLKDCFLVPDGTTRPDGSKGAVNLPTLLKDVAGFGSIGGAVQTVGHKLHPLLNAAIEMINNRDFYGNPIFTPHASPGKNLGELGHYAAKQFTPFSVQGMFEQQRSGASPGRQAMSFMGLSPAPASQVRSPALNLAIENYEKIMPRGGMSAEQQQSAGAKHQLVSQAMNSGGVPELANRLGEEVNAGRMTPKQSQTAVKNAQTQPLVRYGTARDIDPTDSLKVYGLASKEERTPEFTLAVQHKVASAYASGAPERVLPWVEQVKSSGLPFDQWRREAAGRLLYASTGPEPTRKTGEALEQFQSRAAFHDQTVLQAKAKLKGLGYEAQDVAGLLREDASRRNGRPSRFTKAVLERIERGKKIGAPEPQEAHQQ